MSICVTTLLLFKSNFCPKNMCKRRWALFQSLLICHDILLHMRAILINIMSWLISQASKLCPKDTLYNPSSEKHGSAHPTTVPSSFHPPHTLFSFLCIVNEELSLQGDLQPPLLRSGGDLLCHSSSFSISVLDLLIRTAYREPLYVKGF